MSNNSVNVYFDNTLSNLSESFKNFNESISKIINATMESANDIVGELLESFNQSVSKSMENICSNMLDCIDMTFSQLDTSKMLESFKLSLNDMLQSLYGSSFHGDIVVLPEEKTIRVNETIDNSVSTISANTDNNKDLSENPEIKDTQNKKFWTLQNIGTLLSILLYLLQLISWLLPEKEEQTSDINVEQTIIINNYTADDSVDMTKKTQQIQKEIENAIQQVIESISEMTQ